MRLSEKISNRHTVAYAWLVWLVASLFYGIEYLQRVSPTVMAEPLMASFHITASTLSVISSLYFYAYAAAQIPVGLLLDRYGARRLLSLACFVISLGSLLFALSQSLWLLGFARVLIGFGSAFAFIGVLKLASSWFPDKQYPQMVGLTNSLGVIGAIFGQAPLAILINHQGWENSMIILSCVGFMISGLIWLTILDCPVCLLNRHVKKKRQLPEGQLKKALATIVRNRQCWLTACYAGLMVVPIIAFGELWAVPFLTKQYHLSTVMAANVNAAIFLGIGVGGPLNGWLSSYLDKDRDLMLTGNLCAFFALLLIIYYHIPSVWLLFLLLFIFGYATSTMLIAFSMNKNRFAREYNGTVAAFTNIIIVILGAIFQDLIGYLLDHTKATLQHATYSLATYHWALSVLPLMSLLCLILLPFLKKEENRRLI